MESTEEESFIDDEEEEVRDRGAGQAVGERPDSPHPKGIRVRRLMGG